MTSRVFKVDNSNDGILPPTKTTAQKNAITTPPTGLMVYDTDLGVLQIYKNFTVTGKIDNSNTDDTTFTNTAPGTSTPATSMWQTLTTGQTEIVCNVSLATTTNWTTLVSGSIASIKLGGQICIYNTDQASSTVGKGLNYASPTTLGVGVYKLVIGMMHLTDRAILKISIKINGNAAYTDISQYDTYAAIESDAAYNLEKYFTVNTSGSFDIQFTANGKNASSSNYTVLVGPIMVYKLG